MKNSSGRGLSYTPRACIDPAGRVESKEASTHRWMKPVRRCMFQHRVATA